MKGLAFLFGLCLGSFLNVLIDRLPRGESVFWSRSRCDHCKKPLRWFELIPVLSFLIQAGRCRRCRKRLSLQYPLVEFITAVGFVVLFTVVPDSFIRLFVYSFIFSSFLVIFVSDLKYKIIPDSMVIAGVIGAGMLIISQGLPLRGLQGEALWISVVAAFGSSSFFLLLWMVTRGKAMGLGDAKLAFLLGLLLGYPLFVVGFYLAFLTGAVVGVILMITGKKTVKSRIAFGPFLIAGAVGALIFGKAIVGWWKGLL